MNLNELNQKLLAAARRNAPSDHVPYAFEKRIMAHLAARPVPDTLALWGQALFRAAVSCAALVLVLGVAAFYLPAESDSASTAGPELSQDFQDTLLAAVDVNDQNDPGEPADQTEEL